MIELLQPRLKNIGSLGELLPAVREVLDSVKIQVEGLERKRIGYVSGIISSDGPDKIQENIERLKRFTDTVRSAYQFPVFSATDIFTDEIYQRCSKDRPLLNADFIQFWRNLLEAGLVTDVFMTPRWEESEGATDEHSIAEQEGLNIHYINPNG